MTQRAQREAIIFPCADSDLVGILHRPDHPGPLGVIIVPGVPQYRVGAHRMFVSLADHVAASGHAVLRFDPRGLGDSDGPEAHFTKSALDIEAAIATLMQRVRNCRQVVLIGLCDGATAILLGGIPAPEVRGLVLINPWLREGLTPLRTRQRNYYLSRLFQWRSWRNRLMHKEPSTRRPHSPDTPINLSRYAVTALHRLTTFGGASLLVLSGDDIVAREFEDGSTRHLGRDGLNKIPSITIGRIPAAKHTFTQRDHERQLQDMIGGWLSRFHGF